MISQQGGKPVALGIQPIHVKDIGCPDYLSGCIAQNEAVQIFIFNLILIPANTIGSTCFNPKNQIDFRLFGMKNRRILHGSIVKSPVSQINQQLILCPFGLVFLIKDRSLTDPLQPTIVLLFGRQIVQPQVEF